MKNDRARGFGILELLVTLAVTLSVVAALAAAAAAGRRVEAVFPASVDVDQALRVALDAVAALVRRGRSANPGDSTGARLLAALPPVFPHRRGVPAPDSELSAYADRFTVLWQSGRAGSAPLAQAMATPAVPVRVRLGQTCPAALQACGFRIGDRALVTDDLATSDLFSITGVGPDLLFHGPVLASAFDPASGARVTGVDVEAVSWDAAMATLRSSVNAGAALPLVDDVVGFEVRYFGDPTPPAAPRPPPGTGNCLFDAAGTPLLPTLAATDGELVELTPAMLSDGPICGAPPFRFDADLYRIRLLRITIRVQAALPSLRGRDPRTFVNPGPAEPARSVPDAAASIDVAVRAVDGGGL